MSDLLFVPLDVEITNLNFELGESATRHQAFWTTNNVVKLGNNYDNYRWLLDQLSLDSVSNFTHKIQKSAVRPHLDFFDYGEVTEYIQQLLDNEPSGFHVVLKGNVDSLEIFNGVEWVNPILPKVPIAYLLNLTSCYHRVKEDCMRETLYIHGIINKQKHQELLNRSLNKYGHLAVYRKTGQ